VLKKAEKVKAQHKLCLRCVEKKPKKKKFNTSQAFSVLN